MIFLNPYDLVEVIGLNEIDITKIKRIKRRVFAELELLDNEIEIKNQIYSKSEVVELFDIVEKNSADLDYYYFFFQNPKLNDFLYGLGDRNYLVGLKDDLKLDDKGFMRFISPFLSERISKMYRDAFLDGEIDIIELEFPLEERYLEKIYTPVYQILQDKINELYSFKQSGKFGLDDVRSVIGSIELINAMPDYFVNIRSELAFSIRNLAIDAWNEQQNISLSSNLINDTLKIKVDTKTRDKFLSDKGDLEDVRNNIENNVIEALEIIGKKLESGYALSQETVEYVKQLITNIDKHDRVAKLLQYISLISWSKIRDIDISLKFTSMALSKVSSSSLKDKILNEKHELQQQSFTLREPNYRLTPSLNTNSNDSNSIINYIFGILSKFFILYIIVMFFSIIDSLITEDTPSKSSTSHTESYQDLPTDSKPSYKSTTDYTEPSSTTSNFYDWSQELYKSNQAMIDSTSHIPIETTIPDENRTYSLTVRCTPNTAKVRILNIKPKYQNGIKLKKGKYHVEVSQRGYKTIKKWITLSKDSVFDFSLTLPPKVSMPHNGTQMIYTNDEPIAPFEIKTSKGANYLVKLVSASTQKTVMRIFIKGGNRVLTKVPLGRYEVKYATGTDWYGYTHLFGPYTGYSKAETVFDFKITEYQVSGYTITLYRVLNGNLKTSTISPSEF